MIDMTNTDRRFIITPAGKAWMFGWDGETTVTVHFEPEGNNKTGANRCFEVSECEEVNDED
jgi:hypothetical protein